MRILTAGYGNRGFEGFVALMKRHGVTHIVDVRSVPQSSYWEDFRRPRLERILPEAGLRYVYMGDTLGGVSISASLGDADPESNGFAPSRPQIFCKTDPSSFELHPLFADPMFRLGRTKLIEALSVQSRKICLMCGCLRPHGCHRSRLIGEALSKEGVEVVHIDEKGEPVSHERIVLESAPQQNSLF